MNQRAIMKRAPSFILCSLLLLQTLVGCGKKSEKKPHSKVQVQTYFVLGDPETIIAGSTKDATSFITTENLQALNDFALTSVMAFTEKEELIKDEAVNPGNIEAGNEATEGNALEEEHPTFTVAPVDGGFLYGAPKAQLQLFFTVAKGKLDLSKVYLGKTSYPAKVIHYSVKADGNAFSILFSVNDRDGKNLVALTFVRKAERVVATADKRFRYLAGPGVKVAWPQDQDLKVYICGDIPEAIAMKYYAGTLLWEESLKGRLGVKVGWAKKFPPFSDLNSQCIYTVDNYRTEQSEESSNPAITVPNMDPFRSQFVDSDIIVWRQEIKKMGVDLEEANLLWYVGHEFGHLLGLDHQFEDGIKSIMSYDGVSEITDYDKEAIGGLYELSKN